MEANKAGNIITLQHNTVGEGTEELI